MNDSNVNPWNIGTLDKQGIWTVYILFNALGVIGCLMLVVGIGGMRTRRRTSADVLVANLCLGCIWMSLTCGSQCLVSAVHRYFWGGDWACSLEAFFHISAILVQFTS